jgi:hypothetical protein
MARFCPRGVCLVSATATCFVLGGTTDMFNDRIYSTKRAASALPSDKNKQSNKQGELY